MTAHDSSTGHATRSAGTIVIIMLVTAGFILGSDYRSRRSMTAADRLPAVAPETTDVAVPDAPVDPLPAAGSSDPAPAATGVRRVRLSAATQALMARASAADPQPAGDGPAADQAPVQTQAIVDTQEVAPESAEPTPAPAATPTPSVPTPSVPAAASEPSLADLLKSS